MKAILILCWPYWAAGVVLGLVMLTGKAKW